MSTDVILFWLLALFTLAGGLSVILMVNPIYCALCLALSMIGVSALFVTLGAYFLAGVQLIVYAGAVMVLFVMVIMLFDLKHELSAFSRGPVLNAMKLASAGLLAGLVTGAIYMSQSLWQMSSAPTTKGGDTAALGMMLFSRYIFGFEALGVLLLIVAIGAVALARSKGGTHAK